MNDVNDEERMVVSYGIIVCFPDKPNEIIHFCGYPEKYSLNDVKSLTIELMTNEEFYPINEYMDELIFRKATPKEIEWANDNQQ